MSSNIVWMRGARRTIASGIFLLSGFLTATAAPEITEEALSKGTRVVSLSGGAAFGTRIWGGELRHDAAVLNLHYGSLVSDLLAEGHFYRGRVELGGNFSFAQHYKPNSAFLFDAAAEVRYIFDSSERWKPFVDAGIGFAYTDIGKPNLGGKFQFSPQGGVGLHWFFSRHFALTFQERYVHYSNGGLRSPNSGVNQFVTLIGATRFY